MPLALAIAAVLIVESASADDVRPAATSASRPALALRAADVDQAVIEDWPASEPLPRGYRRGTKQRDILVNTGVTLLLIFYLPSLAIAGFDNGDVLHAKPLQSWLFLPVAGPFVVAGEVSLSAAQVLLVTDGVFQAAGAGLIALGLVWQKPVLLRESTAGTALRPAPFVTKGGAGFSVQGTF